MNIKHGVCGALLVAALAGVTGCGAQSGPAVDGPGAATSEAAAESRPPAATTSEAEPTATTEGYGPATTSAETAPAEQTEAAEEVVITIKDFDYEIPESIAPGATITVVNEDAAPHTVTATDEGGFDADAAAGQTVTFTAPEEPGEYEITCTYHPQMSGTLVVQ